MYRFSFILDREIRCSSRSSACIDAGSGPVRDGRLRDRLEGEEAFVRRGSAAFWAWETNAFQMFVTGKGRGRVLKTWHGHALDAF